MTASRPDGGSLAPMCARCSLASCYALRQRIPHDTLPACCRVLVAHPNPAVRALVSLLLRIESFTPIEAERTDDVFRLVFEDPPDVVIVNQRLGSTTGASVVAALRGSPSERVRLRPILALCSDARGEGELLAAGASRCVRKPFAECDLMDAIRSSLDSSPWPPQEGGTACCAS